MKNTALRLFLVYLFFIGLVLFCNLSFGQITAVHFNADWNSGNNVEWFNQLSDVDKGNMDIAEGGCQEKYKIAVVPTIVIFDDGEEVKRFQADLSFKLLATKEEIQDYIDELIMSKF